MRLVKQQIERQDFVDNVIFELMQKLVPALKKLEWDIEIIGAVRDAIGERIIDKKFMSEKDFYPYLKI